MLDLETNYNHCYGHLKFYSIDPTTRQDVNLLRLSEPQIFLKVPLFSVKLHSFVTKKPVWTFRVRGSQHSGTVCTYRSTHPPVPGLNHGIPKNSFYVLDGSELINGTLLRACDSESSIPVDWTHLELAKIVLLKNFLGPPTMTTTGISGTPGIQTEDLSPTCTLTTPTTAPHPTTGPRSTLPTSSPSDSPTHLSTTTGSRRHRATSSRARSPFHP